jgi:hypothetical protein
MRPKKRKTQLTGELAATISEATEEESQRRYASVVGELVADVSTHLEGRPIASATHFADSLEQAAEVHPPGGPSSIAILPFQALAVEDKTDEYLGVGMADALITKLSNIRRILVRPTSSVLRYAQGPHIR